jgi:hypothetical protein
LNEKILTPAFIIKWAVVHPDWAPVASSHPSMFKLMTSSNVFRHRTTMGNKMVIKLTFIAK